MLIQLLSSFLFHLVKVFVIYNKFYLIFIKRIIVTYEHSTLKRGRFGKAWEHREQLPEYIKVSPGTYKARAF